MKKRVTIDISLTRDIYDALADFASANKRSVAQQAEGCIIVALVDAGYYEIPTVSVHLLEKWEIFKAQQEGEQ